jgi:hypothetical protein
MTSALDSKDSGGIQGDWLIRSGALRERLGYHPIEICNE